MERIKKDIECIYRAAIRAVNPEQAVRAVLDRKGNRLVFHLGGTVLLSVHVDEYEKIIVIGAGKATASMAQAVEYILDGLPVSGCISVKYGYTAPLRMIEMMEAAHPVPDEKSVAAAAKIVSLLKNAGPRDLVISLISGGGSSLLCMPPEGITLEEKRKVTDLLLKSGAAIGEINTVRKHLSQVKGGNLARAAFPATVMNLMISDVVGDAMDAIASGPFVPDSTTFAESLSVMKKYGILDQVPASVAERLSAGASGKISENPPSGDLVFARVTNGIAASNAVALAAARGEAEKLGYNTLILSSAITGDTCDAARWHSEIGLEVLRTSNPMPAPVCILSGGETTVEVKGSGMGGRNMEFALHAAELIRGHDGIIMASVGTDGTDGPTDAAGAIADGMSVFRAEKLGLDIKEFIKNNDSYNFFKATGDLIVTGPTNTNVMDVRIVMVRND